MTRLKPMDRKLVLIGGGGHCKSVLDAALKSNEYAEIVITDPIIQTGTSILGCEVIGKDDRLPVLKSQGFLEAFITVGSIKGARLREKLVEIAHVHGFIFPVIIDPSASVSEYVQIGEGTFVGKNAVINADVHIGKHCIINTGTIIEHECMIGDFVHVAVGAILCGNVRVGAGSFIGAGSTIIQGISIGNESVIGVNSTVLTDVKDKAKAYGIVKKMTK